LNVGIENNAEQAVTAENQTEKFRILGWAGVLDFSIR
jgi:hypothetical protein